MKKHLTKHNLKRTIYHLSKGNYSFIYEKFKIKAKQIQKENSKFAARDGSWVTEYYQYISHQNNNLKENIAYKKHHKLNLDIRTIAFYLPQFHPIKENDKWWGKGFTEWKNVTKALPQFEGHYQPHLAGELGYYDLRLPEVQKRQVELAKNYNISGFCFHFYWFNGYRLLEKPLENYLADKSLDLPFCVNWANENWTRTWEGNEKDILMEQKYSDKDDLAFIEEVSKLFKDSRYMRVDSRPILLIYRSTEFPNIKQSATRWRKWCREHEIGEIYLVLVHAFEDIDPLSVNFDAATEFAPNSFPLEPIEHNLNFYNDSYEGKVHSYTSAISYAKSFKTPRYKKFRSLCPSWDNEARKTGKGSTIHGATPDAYATWLKELCNYTDKHFAGDEKLIFINAWNEWAEGAHLEPDQKFGYGYLEQTYQTLHNFKNPLLFDTLKSIEQKQSQNQTAVIVHLYYVDIWNDLKKYFNNIEGGFDLFININTNISHHNLKEIRKEYPNASIISLENKGRDILPFIKIFKAIEDKDYKYICKLHSKKSFHRVDGDIWRDHLISSIIGTKENVIKAKNLLDKQEVGIVIASENILSYKTWIGANAKNVKKFAKKANIQIPKDFNFPSGSIFWFKPEALKSLTQFIDTNDFEEEIGLNDGTIAHAIERIFGLVSFENNFSIVEI